MMHKEEENMNLKNGLTDRFILELSPGDYRERATDDGIAHCLNLMSESESAKILRLLDNEPEGVRHILVKNSVEGASPEYLVEIKLSGGQFRKFLEDRDIIMEILWNYIDDETLPDLSDWMDVSDEM